jgi:hypothetical protein
MQAVIGDVTNVVKMFGRDFGEGLALLKVLLEET